MAMIRTNIEINDAAIQRKLDSLVSDEATMLEIHNEFAKRCDPYVPFLEGLLSQTVEVTAQGVRYVQPYARYQYYGVLFNHTLEHHPQASAKWDEAMMAEHGDEFRAQIHDIIRRRARQL